MLVGSEHKSVRFQRRFSPKCGSLKRRVERRRVVALDVDSYDSSCRAYGWRPKRSEEHTSELPSPDTISYAVFCLKKKITIPYRTILGHTHSTATTKYYIHHN